MAETKSITWGGASGAKYEFYIFELPVSLDDEQDGNYIWAKIVNNKWVAIYIGEGDLGKRSKNHHKADCINRKGATHFLCHKNNKNQDRLDEEDDLLEAWGEEAYAPKGCNEKKGG